VNETVEATPSIAPEELGYGIDVTGLDPASLSDALRAVISDVMMDPLRMSTWLTGLALAEQNVALNMLRRLGGEAPPGASPADDKRFADPEWRTNPILAGFVEDYRARTQAALQLVDSARLPEATRRKARFAMQLMCDAFAPSNVPWLNPGVVKEATESGGMSLVKGLQNFLDDVENNGGRCTQHRCCAARPGSISITSWI
jgi:polyhydroxyalkanoate synthase